MVPMLFGDKIEVWVPTEEPSMYRVALPPLSVTAT